MNRTTLPPFAVVLGVAGVIPFLVCSLGVLALRGGDADRVLLALVGYGAVILAFLGGVHWGFALPTPDAPGPRQSPRMRLGLGVLPSLAGWLALVLPLVAAAELGLAVLVVGFIGTTAVEARGTEGGLLSRPYMWLRWGLSAAVVTCLLAVLVARLAGVHLNL